MLTLAIVLLALEALALVAAAIAYVIRMLEGDAESISGSLFAVAMVLAIAAVVALGCRALARGRRWGRGVAFTWQIFQVTVAVGVISGAGSVTAKGIVWVAFAVLLMSLVVIVALLLPKVIAATTPSAAA